MTLLANRHYQSWKILLFFPLLVINSWLLLQVFDYFQPLPSSFVVATLLAFIFYYPVKIIEQNRVDRSYAVLSVVLLTVMIVFVVVFFAAPLLLDQWNEIAKLLPSWIESAESNGKNLSDWVIAQNLPINVKLLVTQQIGKLPTELESGAEQLVALFFNSIDNIGSIVFTLALSIYLLLDEGRFSQRLFNQLPHSFGDILKSSLKQRFQSFLLGQISLASIVGLLMTTAFVILQVPFGLLLGIGVGVMSLVPLGDVLGFLLAAIIVGSQNLWLGGEVLLTAIVVDQVIDQAIAPRILSGFTGLSPVELLMALAVGFRFGGLLGLLIAVPIAGCLNDLKLK